MTREQKQLIAEWISAWAMDDDDAHDRVNERLKATGLWAYEAGSGFPTIGHWYNGKITVGMRFKWNDCETCRVTKLSISKDDDGLIVWARNSEGEYYNEESYFRSMVRGYK